MLLHCLFSQQFVGTAKEKWFGLSVNPNIAEYILDYDEESMSSGLLCDIWTPPTKTVFGPWILRMSLGNSNIERKKGFLKFNASLLHDDNYVSKIKTIFAIGK